MKFNYLLKLLSIKRSCKILVLFLSFFSTQNLFAQYTQTVKGKITDKGSGVGLPGVIVQLKSQLITKVVTTDSEGNFKMMEVPIGRQSFLFSLTGYKFLPINDLIITSGKQVILNLEMEENAVNTEEVVVNAKNDSNAVINLLNSGVKAFSIEETERYAGSRQDPARMAANFAGVQGTNDSRNDIIVRGNSPSGLLWRLEEIDIPNPNHFAIAGSAGGPQSIINNKYLANSEFYNGAFPANYGNALGGVFDLKMRNGNNEKHEKTFQFGVLGTELALEGPINKKSGASYLFSYRYSTLALFSSINFRLGTSAVPGYQDFGLRLNFPTKRAGVFSFSSIGGLSDIKIILSKTKERPKELYGDLNRDQYFGSRMGVGILNHVYSFNSRTLIKTSLAYAAQSISSEHYLVLREKDFKPNDTLPQILGYHFLESKTTLSSFVKSKINARNSIKAGFFFNIINVNFNDSIKFNSLFDTMALAIQQKPFRLRENSKTSFCLIQPYISYVHLFNAKLSLNAGVFSQILTLNNRYSIEPRASLRYQLNTKQVLSLAYGLHSQMQQTYLYFAIPDSIVKQNVLAINSERTLSNKSLDFSKSQHVVLGYDYFLSKNLKIKTEIYYQYLWNIPVYVVPSSVSAINRGATFTRFFPIYTMLNKGIGYNYGIELTIEKLFHKHYFFMLNGSLFESKYKGSNGVEHNTDFNGNYLFNFLGGLEYNVGTRNSINLGFKFTYGGGRRYSPPNVAASNAIMDVVPQDDKINTLQFPAYNRLDLRIAYKMNGRKSSTEISLDLVNLLNVKNVLALSYAPDPSNYKADPLIKNYQLGFLPLLYVKVDF